MEKDRDQFITQLANNTTVMIHAGPNRPISKPPELVNRVRVKCQSNSVTVVELLAVMGS